MLHTESFETRGPEATHHGTAQATQRGTAMITMTSTLMKAIRPVVGIGFLASVTLAGSSSAFAQVAPNDPSLEVFRIRCQIDADINPATGLAEPKVQIQAKARADILDGWEVGFLVENISVTPAPLPPSVVYTVFELGSATADWDTFPDALDLNPVTVVDGEFVLPDEFIRVTAQVTDSGQTVTDIAQCADKTSAHFTQQTKGV